MFFLQIFSRYLLLDLWFNMNCWAAYVFRHMLLDLAVVKACRTGTSGQTVKFIAVAFNQHQLMELNTTDDSCWSYCAVLTVKAHPKSQWHAVDNELNNVEQYITWPCPQSEPWSLLHQYWVRGYVWNSREFLQASPPSPVIWSQT